MGNTLHEASFTADDLIQIAKGLGNVASTNNTYRTDRDNYSYSSIAKAASKLIAVFPVLSSRTVSFDTARMTSKYIEQISCQFFMFALQQANISSAKDGIAYLRQFHQNLNMGDDTTDAVISTMQTWLDNYMGGYNKNESGTLADSMINDAIDEEAIDPFAMQSDDIKINASDLRDLMHMMQENANIEFYDTKLNPLSIDDFIVREFESGTYNVSISANALNEARKGYDNTYNKYYTKLNDKYKNRYENSGDDYSAEEAYRQQQQEYRQNKYNFDREKERNRHKEEMAKQRNQQDRNTNEREKEQNRAREADQKFIDQQTRYYQDRQDRQKKENEEKNKEAAERTERTNRLNGTVRNVDVLRDQDIKKMNDAVPSILVVKFFQKTQDGGISNIATEFLIGIKAKVVPITTAEILRRIMNDNRDGQKFLKFMRVITGELKATDLIFGLSHITDDVKSYKVKGARGDIWTLLQNRAVAAKEQVRSGKHNDFSAITTVLISQQDADELYREENFDITDPKNAIHFMQSYNLMGFAIADDSNEVLHLLLDNGSKNFEDIAYRMLERETQDGTYKKLINLMASSK